MEEDANRAASQETPAAYLHLVDTRSNHQSQQLFPVWDQEIFKIGRDPRSNTLAIDNDVDFTVSRNHCEIYVVVYEPTVNHVYVRDRKSSNGTFVNGQLIGSGPDITPGYLLQNGDLFASKYRVTDHCLGHGAEAVVCLASDVQTGKQLVCKLVNLDKIQGKNSQEDIRRKFQEADILRQLRHPNILPYTFTELASGGDLMSFLLRHDTVEEFDSRIIMRQVVRGLCYLHEKDIVHRDLKPENILLAYSPKIAYHRVMLSDFGNSAVPRRSRMITNAGTKGYQAPEFAMNGQAHTSAVDIWSLGVVALLLLASDHCDTELNKMDEEEIGEYLTQTFNTLPKKPSSDGIDFVWSCLKLNPLHRISAHDAKRHDWLCSPKKHLKFFKRLDHRILSSWKPQDKLKPMPWVLQDLAQSSPPTPTRSSGSSVSQYFTTTPTQVEDSAERMKQEGEDELDESGSGSATDELASPFLIPARPSSARLSELEPQQMRPKQVKPPWHDFHKPSSPTRNQLSSKRKRVPKARVHDTAGLPLPGLDRHLRSPANYRHRQNILSALEKTNSKFLVDRIPILPSTPVDVPGTPMPASPKKRKSTYDVRIQGLAGTNMLEVPQLKFR
ncbi:hypothetical protein NW762_005142 [Fusarium torreyae]|uniref:Serine/threonine protein kinase n=1 Tax=Fusarium torreyae TaxID=1237075 RepID=A0A9W8S320_9HYPO|nr:hypothetical protein NW762_005142 [Fusarium torreyae]